MKQPTFNALTVAKWRKAAKITMSVSDMQIWDALCAIPRGSEYKVYSGAMNTLAIQAGVTAMKPNKANTGDTMHIIRRCKYTRTNSATEYGTDYGFAIMLGTQNTDIVCIIPDNATSRVDILDPADCHNLKTINTESTTRDLFKNADFRLRTTP